MTTFGFEAEFQVNAAAVIEGLYDLKLSGASRLHGYHCDCGDCEFGSYVFRGQTDSSCSGEIISDVFDSLDDIHQWVDPDGSMVTERTVRDILGVLSDIAINVDAEPGPNSGFHVHVGVNDIDRYARADILWQFVRWEQILESIAAGRWTVRRDGMNATVRSCVDYVFAEWTAVGRLNTTNILAFEQNDNEPAYGTMEEFKQAILMRHSESDRHTNLNTQVRQHPTWEFRLWNSTRAAWRMEMFCGLSVALVDPRVVNNLSVLEPPRRRDNASTGIDSIAQACDDAGHERIAELLLQQAYYLDNRAQDAPAVLTYL